MLNKINRLTKEKDFENLFKNGQAFHSQLFNLKIVRNKLNNTRFGFIISKKVSKKAVERNKIKRRLREVIRKEIEQIKNGYDAVIIVKNNQEVIKKEYLQIKNEVDNLIKKAKILK